LKLVLKLQMYDKILLWNDHVSKVGDENSTHVLHNIY